MSDSTLAEARVVRTITLVLGVGVVIYAALSASAVIEQANYVNPVWSAVAAVVVFVIPPVLAALSGVMSLHALRLGLGVYAIAFMLAVGTWVFAMHGEPVPPALSPWPLAITSIGTVPAALAWRPSLAWLAVAANAGLLAIVRFVAAGEVDLPNALQDGLFGIAFSSIFTAVAIVAIRNARALDAAALTARSRAAGAASVAARMHEQARLDALVHDELITALYYATTDRGELTGSVRLQARRALDELARLDSDQVEFAPVDPAEFTSRLRAVLLDLSSGLALAIHGRRTRLVPAAVADAFAEGATEALRNSLRHAGGAEVSRQVTIMLSDAGVTLVVRDDGSGFDPAAVDPYRLGILVSIHGRLDAVDNGSARVTSAPGKGTAVTLEWRDQ